MMHLNVTLWTLKWYVVNLQYIFCHVHVHVAINLVAMKPFRI